MTGAQRLLLDELTAVSTAEGVGVDTCSRVSVVGCSDTFSASGFTSSVVARLLADKPKSLAEYLNSSEEGGMHFSSLQIM